MAELAVLGKPKDTPKAKNKIDRDITVVISVGCGGLFYQGLPRMATFLNKRKVARVILLDGDRIELKNTARQWGGNTVSEMKVKVASKVLETLHTGPATISGQMLKAKEDLMNLIIYDKSRYDRGELRHYKKKEERVDYFDRIQKVVVVVVPDNHLCRKVAHEGCANLAQLMSVEVYEVVAGNGPDYGYAYGCIHGKTKCMGDWTRMHPDIIQEADREAEKKAQPASCGAMEESVPGQTAHTNQLTSICIWDMVEMMVSQDREGKRYVGETYWVVEVDPKDNSPEGQRKKITTVRAKLEEVK
jgi:hypothetical protein